MKEKEEEVGEKLLESIFYLVCFNTNRNECFRYFSC